MTLIESALQKLQQSSRRPASAPLRPTQARVEATLAPPQPPPAARPPPAPLKLLHATIDSVVMERNCVLPRVSDETALRAYKILRTRVLQRMSANNWTSLLVTGSDVEQGKTLTAINLAFALAQDPATQVCLVDLDLRRPHVAGSMGMQFNYGLGDYLSGSVEADQIMYEVGVPRMCVIPNSQSLQHSSELLSSPRMVHLVEQLAHSGSHRVVIFDMPPLLMSDDVLVFSKLVDTMLFVVSEGQTERGTVEKAKEVLGEMNVLGVVLNRSAETNEAGYY
jgi:capsular exopolysaccharide synthesis family protein